MEKISIKGGKPLFGKVEISGSKNSSLAILASCLLTDKKISISGVPKLTDTFFFLELLNSLGAEIDGLENFEDTKEFIINAKKITNNKAPYNLVKKMRASILVLGPLLSRFKKVKISLPGGCAIGTRPIDIHLFGLEKLGVKFTFEKGYIYGQIKNNLVGSFIDLPFSSVGATENIMMAAVLSDGMTTINNAAKEPEITDLADCLNKMGAKIYNAGTNTIQIQGVKNLLRAEHTIINDRIVAGTFIIAAIMLNKDFLIKKINPKHLTNVIDVLIKMGANLEIGKDFIKVLKSDLISGIEIETKPYPGFPTDLQAQIMSLMTLANGNSKIKENIFENRFMHVPELNRLGAKIKVKNDEALIQGNNTFKGAQVMASDLRASVSLVLAGLCAEGETIINRVYHLDRGYEKIEEILGKCGPKIVRLK